MGKGWEEIAGSSRGSENNWLGTCETHDVGSRPREDRGGAAGKVGEGEGGAEEGGVGPTEPAAGCGRPSCFKSIVLG
jgi:hypothetical protein